MKTWQIILVVLLNLAWIIPVSLEALILPLISHCRYLRKYKNWSKSHPDLERIYCRNCKHCISETFFSGRYPNGFPERHPTYCKLMKRKLNLNKNTHCMIAEPPKGFFKSKDEEFPLPASDEKIYLSAYGSHYHSSRNCPSIKGSDKIYCSFMGTFDRSPCPKCWIEQDGKLIPKNNSATPKK